MMSFQLRLLASAVICATGSLASCGFGSSEYVEPVQNATEVVTTPNEQSSAALPAAQKVAFKRADLNLCEGSPVHKKKVPVARVAKPPFMKAYRDPAFGTKVTRITNSREGEVYKPLYSTIQAWNADESLLILYKTDKRGPRHILLDGHTYEVIRDLKIIPADVENVFWSHTNPDIFYYVNKYARGIAEFREVNARTGKIKLIKDFKSYCGRNGVPTAGGDVHMQSLDDDLFGFRCRLSQKEWVMMSYRRSTDELVIKPLGKDKTAYHEWSAPIPGPSGNRFWMQGDTLSTDLERVEATMDMYKNNEHSNVGTTYNGQDALFQVVFDPSPSGCKRDADKGVGHLVEHNLETGDCRTIISEADGYPYTTSGTHASARAIHQPGWVTMSSIGYGQFDLFQSEQPAPALFSEVYLANTDPKDEVVCRLAQHRSFGKSAKNGNYNAYFGEPHATASPSGTRIIFGSDWYDSGSVDSYVIELPSYRKP